MGQGNVELICAMLATRGEMLQQIGGLKAEMARTRPEPNEWSVVEVLQHVSDIDQLMVRRFGEIRAGKEELSANNPADWEAERRAAEREGLSGVLLRVYAARVELLQAVSGLSEADLEKSARHPAYGPRTIRRLVETIINHDREHAGQIAKARAAVEG